jgi:hypothetical protein
VQVQQVPQLLVQVRVQVVLKRHHNLQQQLLVSSWHLSSTVTRQRQNVIVYRQIASYRLIWLVELV